MNFFDEKQIIIQNNPTPNFIVTHEKCFQLSIKKILEVFKLAISKAVDFIDITQFIKKSMNESDNSNKWQCFC